MTDLLVEVSRPESSKAAKKTLNLAAQLWFSVATIGMWIFVFYVAVYYGGFIAEGGLRGLQASRLPTGGFIEGDTVGNISTVFHLFIATIIIGGGTLQLMPQLRSRFPRFHRWNGRIYITTAVITSIAGLILVWTRETAGDLSQHLGLSLDAILIIVFAGLALRYAVAGKIAVHRRWALRLFMVVNAVWFFRIGLMAWFALTGGVGINTETFTGPFLTFLAFADYLLPLAMLELYLWAQDRAGAGMKFSVAGVIFVCTAVTGIGIFVATVGMWLPVL